MPSAWPTRRGVKMDCMKKGSGAIRAFCLVALFVVIGLSGCAGGKPLLQAGEGTVVLDDGVTLDYAVSGSGRPLLLVTGYAMTKEMWDADFLRDLAASRRVILMDNRGMGPSPLAAAAEVSIPRMARDAVAVLDVLGIDRADVLGWSMGGMVAQELALQRPDRVCAVILLATTADVGSLAPVLERLNAMGSEEIRQSMFPADWVAGHPEASARLRPRPRPPDMHVVAAQHAAMLQWAGTAGRLREMSAPVLVVAGAEDWICPPGAGRDMYEDLSGREGATVAFTVVPQGSHWMMHQFPDALAAMVNGFLAGRDCAPAP